MTEEVTVRRVSTNASHDDAASVMSCSMGQLIAMTEWSSPSCRGAESEIWTVPAPS
jgi:hypothetical protein